LATSTLKARYQQAVFPDETPETRQRLQDVCEAFEKLEKELRLHIEQLRANRWERVAIRLTLLSTAPK
jgi:hypothetical protein